MKTRGSVMILALLALTLMLAGAVVLSRAMMLRLRRESNAFRTEAGVVAIENALEQARAAWLKNTLSPGQTQQIAGVQVRCAAAGEGVRLEGSAPVQEIGLPPAVSRALHVTWEFQKDAQTGAWRRYDWQRRIETIRK